MFMNGRKRPTTPSVVFVGAAIATTTSTFRQLIGTTTILLSAATTSAHVPHFISNNFRLFDISLNTNSGAIMSLMPVVAVKHL